MRVSMQYLKAVILPENGAVYWFNEDLLLHAEVQSFYCTAGTEQRLVWAWLLQPGHQMRPETQKTTRESKTHILYCTHSRCFNAHQYQYLNTIRHWKYLSLLRDSLMRTPWKPYSVCYHYLSCWCNMRTDFLVLSGEIQLCWDNRFARHINKK